MVQDSGSFKGLELCSTDYGVSCGTEVPGCFDQGARELCTLRISWCSSRDTVADPSSPSANLMQPFQALCFRVRGSRWYVGIRNRFFWQPAPNP